MYNICMSAVEKGTYKRPRQNWRKSPLDYGDFIVDVSDSPQSKPETQEYPSDAGPVLDRRMLKAIQNIHPPHFGTVEDWGELKNGRPPLPYPTISITEQDEEIIVENVEAVNIREAEIVNMTNEYLGNTEVVFLGNLPTFLLVPKYPERFNPDDCINLIHALRGEGCIVFWTADTMVLIPPPINPGQDSAHHKELIEQILNMASYDFHIGGGAFRDFCGIDPIQPDAHNSFITITRDVHEYVLNGSPEAFFDNGGLPLIAARRMVVLKATQFSYVFKYCEHHGLLDENGRIPSYLDHPDLTDTFLNQHNQGQSIDVEAIVKEIEQIRAREGLRMSDEDPAAPYTLKIAALASKVVPSGRRWFKSKKSSYGELSPEEQDQLFTGITSEEFSALISEKKFSYPITRETFSRHLVSRFYKLEIDTSDSTTKRQQETALESALSLAVSISLHRTMRYRITQRLRQVYKMHGFSNDEYVPEHLTTGESSTMLIPDELLEDTELRALFIEEINRDMEVINRVYSSVSKSDFHISFLQLPPGTVIGIYRKFIQSLQFSHEAYEEWFQRIEAAAAELSKIRGGVITPEIIGRLVDIRPPAIHARAFGATSTENS